MHTILTTLLAHCEQVLDLAIAVDSTAFQPELLYMAKEIIVVRLAFTLRLVQPSIRAIVMDAEYTAHSAN